MPRSVTGVYSLPLPPVVPGELIEADWANPTLDDVGNALTDSLDRNGRGGMLAPFKFFDGTETAPGAAWANAPGTGFWRDTTALHMSWSSAEIWNTTANGINLVATKEVFVPTAPSTVNSLTNKTYVDAAIASAIATGDFLPRAGGIMTGNITFADDTEGVIFKNASKIYDSGTTFVLNAGATATALGLYINSVLRFNITPSNVAVTGAFSAGAASVTSLASSGAISGTTGSYSGDVTAPNFLANGGYFRVNTASTGLHSNLYGFGWVIDSDRCRQSGGSYTQVPNLLCNGTVYSLYSDDRLKDRGEIFVGPNVLALLNTLDAFRYTRNALAQGFGFEDDNPNLGLSAQQVKLVFPEAVHLAPFDTGPGGTSISGQNYLTIDYARLVPILVAAVNQLKYQIDQIVPPPPPPVVPPPEDDGFPETPIEPIL